MKVSGDRLSWRVWLKWVLLLLVVVLIIINYYAFTEILLGLLDKLNTVLSQYGYYFDVTKPFSVFLNIVVPGFGLVGYIVTLNNKNVIEGLHHIYGEITILQLITLLATLPFLLTVQNKFYSDNVLIHDGK